MRFKDILPQTVIKLVVVGKSGEHKSPEIPYFGNYDHGQAMHSEMKMRLCISPHPENTSLYAHVTPGNPHMPAIF